MDPETCGATWRSTGRPCTRPVFNWLGDAGLCNRHYSRALNAALTIVMRERDAESAYFYGHRDLEASAAEIVYYVRRLSDGFIKIGTSRSFSSRLGQLRKEHGPVQVLATHRGSFQDEFALHHRFRRLRADGEFFRPYKPLLAWIVKVRRHQPEATLLRGTVPMADLMALSEGRSRKPKTKIEDPF